MRYCEKETDKMRDERRNPHREEDIGKATKGQRCREIETAIEGRTGRDT